MKPLVSLKNIDKSFGKVKALCDVSLDIYEGEIHTILGENGAGKSTLINILSGIYAPDKGEISIFGRKVNLSSPRDAISNGIGTVYQHFKLVESMTVKENILLGQRDKDKDFNKKIEYILKKYDIKVNLEKYIEDMSVGERQIVEILKVLYRGAKVLILDEPTTVFTPQEAEKLFNIMRKIKEERCSVIFISHKMDEVIKISNRISVLRKGNFIKTLDKERTSIEELTRLMVGENVDLKIRKRESKKEKDFNKTSNNNELSIDKKSEEKRELSLRDVLIKVEGISLTEDVKKVFNNISFDVKKGEIFGIAGIAGSGQRELCEALAGVRKIKKGDIIFEGENLTGKSVREFMKKGINLGFVPEDRLGMGLVGSMDMVDNLMLKSYQLEKSPFLNRKPFKERAIELVKKLNIKTPDVNYPIKYLSGGNIQKILLGREIYINPKLLILVYPVRGLDINTCYTIYNIINEEREKGNSVIFVGEDLDILIELCDRIMVMSRGEVTKIVDSKDATKEKLGLLMLGMKDGESGEIC
ncbi:nucleoside ABC transporter ATP-binding protein [Caloramator quimbayensis]|uniref:Nucleoside ABC transporter ATP-binding protein n=1 Tax=Caloramator quimbayensis TaxID=1147123 RepID=A0A1T4WKB0_9CLOT|nr:ABC transporter ATP-binding protein [Caloramator quimbayensis]SKA77345.1 nucleoside ABC transporter ATP-binding protein [Caloramator quimbayensis]